MVCWSILFVDLTRTGQVFESETSGIDELNVTRAVNETGLDERGIDPH